MFNYIVQDNKEIAIIEYVGNETAVIVPFEIEDKPVSSIERYAFYHRNDITSIEMPIGIKRIENAAFFSCHNVASIKIPDSITYIGDRAFGGCSNLINVTIPDSVITIEERAFGYNGLLKDDKVVGFTIYGTKGSVAESYAKENGFKFETI